MEAIFHFLGICPDNMSHLSIVNFISCFYGDLHNIFMIVKSKIRF